MTANQNPQPQPVEISPGEFKSCTAANILRGVQRLLRAHAFECIAEAVLANGRRADALALSASGEIWIVEIKSSIADFRADNKWPEYRDYCDRFFFAVAADFPVEILPSGTGLILADRYGGVVAHDAPEHRLTAPRRKAVTLSFARTAAARLGLALEPEFYNNSVIVT